MGDEINNNEKGRLAEKDKEINVKCYQLVHEQCSIGNKITLKHK